MTEKEEEFMEFLEQQGYVSPKQLPDGRFACIYPLAFTHAIITCEMGDLIGISDRWCYNDLADARKALGEWDGTDEPAGWHRHPQTGRRRAGGDPATEFIRP